MRVGRFIGRLGVVSVPAVEVGLGLDQRVVRRHVAKLEAAGWLDRAPWIWGEGSIVWLTGAGIEGAGLGGVRPVKSPPAPTTIAHGVLVGWSAARVERTGRAWRSARELAVERKRWGVTARCGRGRTELLPDLAVWLERSEPPVAVIAESGGRREDRQKMILEGWRDAILSGLYGGVRYDCASESVAHWISRLATNVRLSGRSFLAGVQLGAEEIAALSPAAPEHEQPADDHQLAGHTRPVRQATRQHNVGPRSGTHRASVGVDAVGDTGRAIQTSTGDSRGHRSARAPLPRNLRTSRVKGPPATAPVTRMTVGSAPAWAVMTARAR